MRGGTREGIRARARRPHTLSRTNRPHSVTRSPHTTMSASISGPQRKTNNPLQAFKKRDEVGLPQLPPLELRVRVVKEDYVRIQGEGADTPPGELPHELPPEGIEGPHGVATGELKEEKGGEKKKGNQDPKFFFAAHPSRNCRFLRSVSWHRPSLSDHPPPAHTQPCA